MWVESTRSWVRTVVLGGRALPLQITLRTLLVTGLSVVVTALEHRFNFGVTLTTVPFSLIGVALGIFLGFRNGAAYDRFWEGRKLWGALVNTSRSFTRQVMTLVEPPRPADEERIEASRVALVHQLMAYVHALRFHLRDGDPFVALKDILPGPELDELKDEHNVPIAILFRMGRRLRELRLEGAIHPYHVQILEGSLTAFTDIQGACERIKATPVPFSYSVLMHRLVAGYCVLLPLGLADSVGLAMPLVVAGISYTLFGLDAVGDEIEQPFGVDGNDLPLNQLSVLIERDARKRVAEPLPEVVVPRRGLLL